jgi:hypothetical protein
MATTLDAYHEQRHVVVLSMAIHKNRNLIENKMHDFRRSLLPGESQHGLESFLSLKLPFAVLGFGDSIRVGDEDIIGLQLECPGWKSGVWGDAYREVPGFQVKQFGRPIPWN